MVFLCFSSKERYTITKSYLYHLKNYGIPTWYDYHELILGDHKSEKNFESAIQRCKYFIIIYSKSFFKSPCAITEETIIFEEAKKRKISIFPILYNMQFNELPVEYQLKIENLIYNEITHKTGSISSVNQIVSKILIDKLSLSEVEPTPQISLETFCDINDDYLCDIFGEYLQISSDNFNARIAMLYCIFKYITLVLLHGNSPYYLIKIMDYLSSFTHLNIKYNHKELIIAELVVLHSIRLLK